MKTMNNTDPIQYYGCSVSIVESRMLNSEVFKKQGPVMYAASLMDRAASFMSANKPEEGRQALNCAKWVLLNYVMGDDE